MTNRRALALPLSTLFALMVWFNQALAADLVLHEALTQVYFSPRGGAQDALVAEIGKARESIFVQAYSFTSEPIISALIQAHQRGVHVEVILDKSQRADKRSGTAAVREAGIHAVIDSKHAIAHNKTMVIDHETVVTGSFNITKSAEEKNAENLLIVRSQDLARLYLEDWKKHRQHTDWQ
ncbi:MAG: phospholipase D family protein [Humidesulfovibrio sp.]|uniref:phospholipase D family nuclease n=1 Tax=Humidesulfovibrio sp. TaxID=2910988 RepID=UPI0027F2A988|nr:phospholipase D family protein [Humidesulfovibrio sp.]MDQ7836798.1 phospholipase D family protein [Humidesulfovibrio sp.]